jgi:tetratricopeptide (TPR) repeat protein
VADSPRIDELRRRVDRDPASILFAQLAEEHRRAGNLDEAIRLCRSGLGRYPAYLSARVTLGRALMDMGRLDDAERELEYVRHAAPDNLGAIRSLAELRQYRREAPIGEDVIEELEAWLQAIVDDREQRRVARIRRDEEARRVDEGRRLRPMHAGPAGPYEGRGAALA